MTTDERLMFHLTQGSLRRWSLWNEAEFPSHIASPAEHGKWALFQSWRLNPFKVVGPNQYEYHPMAEFENWSLWLIIDLLRSINAPYEMYDLFSEPEALKEGIVNYAEEMYSNYEEQSPTQLYL